MLRKFTSIIFALSLACILLANSAIPAMAQTPGNDNVITLAQIEGAEIYLNGPYDTSSVVFGLPSDWKLTSEAQLDISLTTALSVVSTSNTPAVYGGLLTIKFNRQTVGILPLSNLGTIEKSIAIPASFLVSSRTDGRMELSFELDSGISCQADQHMNVVINQSTQFTLPHEQVEPSTDLINFPLPIYQDTIYPDSAIVVIPDNPTSTELQATMSVAAGFGNLTSGKVALDLTTVGQLTTEQKNNNHLVFIGQAASLPNLANMKLPLPITNGSFNLTGNPDDGIVEMINSPWNISKAVLVVSGNTDTGVLKAAQAVSTGIMQSNFAPNVAIIENVNDNPNPSPSILNQTLANLGHDVKTLNNRGVSSVGYDFYVPANSTISSDAFFELAYSHSALLDMGLSGIVVLLNGQPIGSVQFTTGTAADAINTVSFALPQTLAHPGTNRIDVRVNLELKENCTSPSLEGSYAVIWPQSRMYIPFTDIQVNTTAQFDLGNYPVPLSYDSTMAGIAFVLQNDNLSTWKSALQVAMYLGDRSNGPISMPETFLDSDYSDNDLVDYNLIVIGTPSQMSVMNKINPALPVPFDLGTDQAVNTYSQVTYRIPIDTPQGYVELLASPWNSEKLVLTALGNTTDSVFWASSALGASPLRSQLAGNFAVINRTQVNTADTRLGPLGDNIALPTIEAPTVQPPVNIDSTPSTPNNLDIASSSTKQPAWIRLIIGVALGLSLLILIFILISSTKKNKN